MKTMHTTPADRLRQALNERIVILDGAMGTMIQRLDLEEADFHLEGTTPDEVELKGCNDVLCLTAPDRIKTIHRAYLDAGADIIETNTFNANEVSLAEYGLQHCVEDINRAAVRLAREAVEESGREAWVAASVGPTSKSLSMAQDLEGTVGWDELEEAYFRQIHALIDAGADLLLLETIFDGLNAKAAIFAARRAMDELQREVPLMLSVTLMQSGRTLSGQTLEAFLATVAHANPIAVGLNCGFGADGMVPFLQSLRQCPCAVSLYPNAGLPNEMGEYDETPESMASKMERIMKQGAINIAGGCCGTTPDHIQALSRAAAACQPRIIPRPDHRLVLAGLEACPVTAERNFMNVGERCNVAGSRKFLRLIKEGSINEAVEIARTQVEAGAQVVDVNMDDAMLDCVAEMERFVSRIGSEPEVARVPVMIDSSKWEVIEAALKRVQGRPVVNSISLKEGEEKFLEHARHIQRMGAAMVVMAFDEQGQADTLERRKDVCRRAYSLLTGAGIPPQDIIFDPNILAVATGIEQHDSYGLDFIRTTEWIRQNLPHAKVSGGLSNLSFSFRGNNYVREAMHSVFLYHAIRAGMDMAIVNAAALMPIDEVPAELREAIEDVLLNRRRDATDRLIGMAQRIKEEQTAGIAAPVEGAGETAALAAEEKIERMLVRGLTDGLEPLLDEALGSLGSAFAVIDGPLMRGMNEVGRLFGDGKMFLPQVVKSARTMKCAVGYLTPHIEAERHGSTSSAGRMVIATVKGDVHDIGKNIVGVIMNCNGYDVTDLGVMVPGETILDRAMEIDADFVGLSGLITPSLEEMCRVARLMEERGMTMPLMIGGAGASALHTAVKIAPCYSGPVVYTRDAAMLPMVAQRFLNPATKEQAVRELREEQERLRRSHVKPARLLTLAEARRLRHVYDSTKKAPAPWRTGIRDLHISVAEARKLINWRPFFTAWKLDASFASIDSINGCDHCRAQWLAAVPEGERRKASEAMQLYKEANRALDRLERSGAALTARVALLPAASQGDDIVYESEGERFILPTLRQQHREGTSAERLALADFLEPMGPDGEAGDHIGLFAVTVGRDIEHYADEYRNQGDDYKALLYQSVADRLAEAGTEWMHRTVNGGKGIRPAIGYPSLPDQSLVFLADKVLHYADLGITPTENGALKPSATTTGYLIPYEAARYFMCGRIDDEQLADYSRRRGMSRDDLARFFPKD